MKLSPLPRSRRLRSADTGQSVRPADSWTRGNLEAAVGKDLALPCLQVNSGVEPGREASHPVCFPRARPQSTIAIPGHAAGFSWSIGATSRSWHVGQFISHSSPYISGRRWAVGGGWVSLFCRYHTSVQICFPAIWNSHIYTIILLYNLSMSLQFASNMVSNLQKVFFLFFWNEPGAPEAQSDCMFPAANSLLFETAKAGTGKLFYIYVKFFNLPFQTRETTLVANQP